jgi:hypothetical protein
VPRANLKNSKNAVAYEEQLAKEFEAMLEHGVVEEVPLSSIVCINPIGAVIKNSDKQRARTLVNVIVTDSGTIRKASEALVAMGQPKIKCRMSTDCTGSGLNGASYSPPFAYSSIAEAIKLVRRNGCMAKGDISRYFYSFPLALKARELFGFSLFSKHWRFKNLPFGLTNCPYYCSTWTAEFCQWATAMGIPNAFMVDDIFVHDMEESVARADMQRIADLLDDVGFGMEKSKFGFGKQLTFIGILIDTVSMTIRMDHLSAGGFLLQLKEYLSIFEIGRSLPVSDLRHLTGKLNWYSEVMQSGRRHIRSLWEYMTGHPRLGRELRLSVIRELEWWAQLLTLWANGDDHVGQFPIVSGAELLSDPDSIELCQSDASGTDGFGYVTSTLAASTSEFEWTSVRWEEGELPSQSHQAELEGLRHFVVRRSHVGVKLIVWVTDSESGCYSINRANCKDPLGFPIVSAIYDHCEALKCQILAVWVPRARNNLADHLSHLAFVLCRQEISGTERISAIEGDPGQNTDDQERTSDSFHRSSV